MRPVIRLLRATIRQRVGGGVTWTRSCLICPIERRRRTGRFLIITNIFWLPLRMRGAPQADCPRSSVGSVLGDLRRLAVDLPIGIAASQGSNRTRSLMPAGTCLNHWSIPLALEEPTLEVARRDAPTGPPMT